MTFAARVKGKKDVSSRKIQGEILSLQNKEGEITKIYWILEEFGQLRCARARLQLLIKEERVRNAALNTLSSSAKLFMKS